MKRLFYSLSFSIYFWPLPALAELTPLIEQDLREVKGSGITVEVEGGWSLDNLRWTPSSQDNSTEKMSLNLASIGAQTFHSKTQISVDSQGLQLQQHIVTPHMKTATLGLSRGAEIPNRLLGVSIQNLDMTSELRLKGHSLSP